MRKVWWIVIYNLQYFNYIDSIFNTFDTTKIPLLDCTAKNTIVKDKYILALSESSKKNTLKNRC